MSRRLFSSRSRASRPLLIGLLAILLNFLGQQPLAQSSTAGAGEGDTWRNIAPGNLTTAEDEGAAGSDGFSNVRGNSATGILTGAQLDRCEPAASGCASIVTSSESTDGPPDPAPPEAHLLLRNGATNRWQSFTLDGLTVTSGGEVALPISANIQPVGRADLDGDTIGDVLLRNEGSGPTAGQFQSYLLAGQTIKDNAVLHTVRDLDYAVISTDDFGGDAKGDLLLRNSSGAWLLYEIDGVTALSHGVPALPTDTALVPRATGDFNGDFRADVLMRRADGMWELYLMDGQLSIDNRQPGLPTLNVWEILAVADYNGDGKDDLLMRRSDTGLWWIYLMDGASVLDERQVIRDYKPLNYEFKSSADFSGDGRADILIRNVNTGIWRLFLMDGTAIIDKGVVELLRSARFSFMDAQDLNNDGKADVILRKDDGRWHATLMDGINPKIESDFFVLQKNLNWFMMTPVNGPPMITGQAACRMPEETPFTITLGDLTVSDPDNIYPDDFTLTVLSGVGYTLTGPNEITPEVDFTGDLSVPVIVNDGIDDSAPFDLLVTVTAVNDPPVITGQTPLSTPEETPLTITLDNLTVSDPDNIYPDDFTLTVLPGAGYALTGPNEVTPEVDFTGDLSVPVMVNDGIDDSAAFDLVVTVASTTPPNIVIIMLDDLDVPTLQDALLAGLMPNLQTHIVDGALEFTESYVTNPLCCPSRASFLSGLYSHNHGAVHNLLLYPGRGHLGAVGVFDDSETIATRMQSVGYTTCHVGKYLNGYGRYPLDADISPAFEQSYVPPGWTEWHATVDPETYCVYNYKINHNGVVTRYDLPEGQTESSELYQTHVLADVVESFIQTHGSGPAPFFLAIMPIAPHWEGCSDAYGGQLLPDDFFARLIRPAPEDLSAPAPPFVPSPAYNEDTSDKPDFLATLPPLTATDLDNLSEQYRVRVLSLIAVDRLIGRLIEALGPAVEETVLIFTSDNGWLYGDYRQGEKIYAYDASAKVPLYIRMPGSTVAEKRGNLVINNDLAPTFLNIAAPGYPDTDFDGRSFAPLLEDPQPPGWIERSHFLIEHCRTSNAPAENVFPSYYALRSPTTLYIETIDGTYTAPGPLIGLELYDVVSDPYSLQSLIRHPQDPPDPVLSGHLEVLKTCLGQTCKDGENAAQ